MAAKNQMSPICTNFYLDGFLGRGLRIVVRIAESNMAAKKSNIRKQLWDNEFVEIDCLTSSGNSVKIILMAPFKGVGEGSV